MVIGPLVYDAWVRGGHTEVLPVVSRDKTGLRRQFSFLGVGLRHIAPGRLGWTDEGDELRITLAHACGLPSPIQNSTRLGPPLSLN